MLTSNNVLPCKLDSGQRNMLPDLSQPFQCEWEGCHLPEERWTHPQDFYWHVKDHAEDQEGKVVYYDVLFFVLGINFSNKMRIQSLPITSFLSGS